MKNREKIIKIKGYIGIFLFIALIVFGKISYMFEISLEIRYYTVYIFLLLGALFLWLSMDLVKSWFNYKDRR